MNTIPQHIAIIMDGNGRWAALQNKPVTYGHYKGALNIRKITIDAQQMGVKALTLYAFSTENWSRSQQEVDYLMGLPAILFSTFISELMSRNIKVEAIGDLDRFPQATRKVILDAIEQTKDNDAMKLVLAVNYGSRAEIVRACQLYAGQVAAGQRRNDLTEQQFDQYLYTSDLPPVDLLIRTSLDYRLSNFLLWQLSYTELYFSDVYWPDFDKSELQKAIASYSARQRRYGGRIAK